MSDRTGIKLQGDLGEQARMDKLKSQWQAQGADKQVVNLNKHKPSIPGLDLASPEGFESVKISRHIGRAVSHILDWQSNDNWVSTRMRGVRERVANNLRDLAQTLEHEKALPEGFPKDGSRSDIIDYLQEKNRYVVADDQVKEVRADVTEQIQGNPEGFDKLTRENLQGIKDYCDKLCERIVGAGQRLASLTGAAERGTESTLAQPQATDRGRFAAVLTEHGPEPALCVSQASQAGPAQTAATPEQAAACTQTAGPEPAGSVPVRPSGPGAAGPTLG